MHIRFQPNADGAEIVGRLNGRSLRLFSERTGRPLQAAIGELVDWWQDDDQGYADIPLNPLDLVAAGYALANSQRPEPAKLGAPPSGLRVDFEDFEEQFDEHGMGSLVHGFGVAFQETAELYKDSPIVGPILKQVSDLIREAGTAAASVDSGSISGPSVVAASGFPASST